ncbi:TonB-dependent receptor plug domain-containing protein [Mucilaginibacter gynuensis]|uniref:TonB-dependent receptor plug domain-containing protein n=1 Tax=Mucilaginibacter gynuensis TaxID=1302236 RepID=A0ABP8FYF7_9SPHI
MLKNKLSTTFFCAVLFISALTAFVKSNDDPLDKISASLSTWTSNLPQEKVYLHTDKPYYALGDTIWFKAYVTVGSRHQLSALSGAVYADLINERDSVEKTLKLPISAGVAKGNFILADTIAEGNYRIRAYTQWMRNAGEDYFFDKTFIVGNAIDKITARADFKYKTEGGKSIVSTIITYTDSDGKPVVGQDVECRVENSVKVLERKKGKTDQNGSVILDMENNSKNNLQGTHVTSVITTTSDGEKKSSSTTFTIKASLAQSDVQFFPESGDLVAGINSRVAFKAIAIDGSSVAVKGSIVDEGGTEVTTFEALHAGMGNFTMRPEAGKTYSAKITYPDGSQTKVNLPKVKDSGYVLAVYNNPNTDTILVRINASANLLQAPQGVNIVAQSGGEMLYASQVKIARAVTSVWIPKKNFPTGISQFTLFNAAGEPTNERLAFIKTADQMQLKLNSSKPSYKNREKVELTLDAKDKTGAPAIGSFSISVIDETKVPVDESTETTILSSLLLSSDLKGYIEKPNYYFTQQEDADKALDNLMLTQGYRRFVWKDLLGGTSPKPVYKAEKLAVDISGRLMSLSKKPSPGGKITLFSAKTNILKDTLTDANGYFSFDNVIIPDSVKFTVQGRNAKNGSLVQVLMNKTPIQPFSLNPNLADINNDIAGSNKAYLASNRKQIEELEKTGKLSRIQQLNEIKIRGKKGPRLTPGMMGIPESAADQVLTFNGTQACVNLTMCLQSRIQGVSFVPRDQVTNYPTTRGRPMQVIVDGYKLSLPEEISEVFDNNSIDPADVAKIVVVRTSTVQISMLGGESLIIITKRGNHSRGRYNPDIANIAPRGFNEAKEFYSPKYDHPKTASELPDLRSTVYWNPNLKTSATGTVKFDFFTADDKGKYKVIVEGINGLGDIGRQVYHFNVE